jgi:urea transporter
VGALSYVDVITGYDIRLGLFYLIPVALATWRTGLTAGLLLSLVSAIGTLFADIVNTRDSPDLHALVPYWNTGIRLGYFAVVAGILEALKSSLERERRRAREDALTGVPNRRAFVELASDR